MLFKDRREAGQALARHLTRYAGRPDVIVLALPRGGVPVGFEVARALRVPLDVFVVRKLGVPQHEELAMGAIASGGVIVMDQDLVRQVGLSRDQFEAVVQAERQELQRRELAYRGTRPAPDLEKRTVLLVDDGLATGASMRAAIFALRQHKPARIIVAAPVGPEEACHEMAKIVDEAVCAATPEPFHAVGLWYQDFGQTADDEVRELMEAAARELAPRPAS
jgi:putative phosphoribosyl transferase